MEFLDKFILDIFYVLLNVHFSIFILVNNQIDAQNFCFTITLFHATTCCEHMCSKHVEAWNKVIVKQKFFASSWLITKINLFYMCSYNSIGMPMVYCSSSNGKCRLRSAILLIFQNLRKLLIKNFCIVPRWSLRSLALPFSVA